MEVKPCYSCEEYSECTRGCASHILKDHYCDCCGQEIEIGERYIKNGEEFCKACCIGEIAEMMEDDASAIADIFFNELAKWYGIERE